MFQIGSSEANDREPHTGGYRRLALMALPSVHASPFDLANHGTRRTRPSRGGSTGENAWK
jgi:hypothetical protein